MTPVEIRQLKHDGKRVAALTAYDYPVARLLDESDVDIILVGDSLGMVVLGYPDTTHVTMEEMLHHTRAVARAVKRALIVADMPFGSYEKSEQAVENAKRLIDAGAQAVKLEGGMVRQAQIEAIVNTQIPLMAHIGMLPQNVLVEGGYKIKGKTEDETANLLLDARAVEKSGAFAVVLELVQAQVAAKITRKVSIPTIGIGSGAECDGQILVTYDLIGLFPWFTPKFVAQRASVAADIIAAVNGFVRETKSA